MTELSIVIVNYNARHFLQICLDALQGALQSFHAETIIIDNQSTDDSCSYIRQHYPWVTFVENTENEGFGRANNFGFKMAKGKYILILNPDTIVQEATLSHCLTTLKENEKIGAIGVKMLDGSGHFLPESKRGLPTPLVAFYKAFGLTKVFPRSKYFARYYLGHLTDKRPCEVEALAGAFMMTRAHILKECGGFDEDFFMYGEDIDLSYRITQMGYQLLYLPKAPIIHFKGESAGRDAVWARHFYEAMELFSKKHFAGQGHFFSTFINMGIRVRKLFAPTKRIASVKNKLSKKNLIVISAKEPKLNSEFYYSFKMTKWQKPDEFIDLRASALLFMPDVDRKTVIRAVKKYSGKMQFFFASAKGDFVLTSPSSASQGEIWDL